MGEDRAILEKDFVKTCHDLTEELTLLDIITLCSLYPNISNNEADNIRHDKVPADRLFRILKEKEEVNSTNVDALIENLEYMNLKKAAKILKSYKSRNANLIGKEIERLKQEKQPVASTASSVPAKSPPSQKGDSTEEQLDASTAPSSPAKSPPSQKGDRTDILFISFSSKNEEKVNKLVAKIESVFGVGSCWTYLEKSLPGDNLPQNIVNAINKAAIMLCMITQDYIDSEPCEKEFLLAKNLKKHMIPLHLEKVLMPYKKKNRQYSPMQLEATNLVYARMYIKNPEKEFQKVIAKIKKCLPGKDANASGRPSTSGRKKRKCNQDGDASDVKVTKKE